jgi:hypothetical protein
MAFVVGWYSKCGGSPTFLPWSSRILGFRCASWTLPNAVGWFAYFLHDIVAIMDPLLEIFGETSRTLYARERLHVVHGDLSRLPSWMRTGLLVDLAALCKRYQGPIEVARGASWGGSPGLEFVGSGGQVRVQGARPEALLALGLTVYFAELEPAVRESGPFLRALESSLGVPPSCSNMGLFVNAPGSGLPMHHDSHDHLFIQLTGTKRFVYVPEPLTRHPTIQFAPESRIHPQFGSVYGRGFPSDLKSLEQSEGQILELQPGSAFFMPAGTLHRTTDQADLCLSLIVSMKPPSKVDLILNALRYKLTELPEMRAPSYGYFDEDGDAEVSALCSAIAAIVPTLDRSALRRAWLTSLHREGVLSEHVGQPYTDYIRVPSTLVRFEEPRDGRVRMRVRPVNTPEAFELEIASDAARLVEHLVTLCCAFSVSDVCERFAEFEEDEVQSLLDQLCRVGLLRPLPFR